MTRSMFRHRLPTIQERILFHLDAAPDARAIAFVDHRGEFEWQTRAQFFGEAARWGGVLESRGVTPGDAVVIVSVEPEFAATSVLATLQLGAIPLLVAAQAGIATTDLNHAYDGVDDWLDIVIQPWDFHPTVDGHQMLADALYHALVPMLKR